MREYEVRLIVTGMIAGFMVGCGAAWSDWGLVGIGVVIGAMNLTGQWVLR